MDEVLVEYGYYALFLLSFVASTLVPLGSEWLLVTLILKGFNPFGTVAVATLGNFLGACTTYAIGIYGSSFLIRRVLRIDEASQEKARKFYGKYGSVSLLLSWMPIVGDPLCLVGGLLNVSFIRFSLLVFSGKLARYAFIAVVTHTAAN
jgi:membrane protein YqaA with SNARE-associated domain